MLANLSQLGAAGLQRSCMSHSQPSLPGKAGCSAPATCTRSGQTRRPRVRTSLQRKLRAVAFHVGRRRSHAAGSWQGQLDKPSDALLLLGPKIVSSEPSQCQNSAFFSPTHAHPAGQRRATWEKNVNCLKKAAMTAAHRGPCTSHRPAPPMEWYCCPAGAAGRSAHAT